MREVQARLAATQVEYISGKVFFTTSASLNMLKTLKSAERLFLLITKQLPFTVSSTRKGKILSEIQRLINDDPGNWLNIISIWKDLLELNIENEKLSQRDANPLKRKVGEKGTIVAKKPKMEQTEEVKENTECQLEKQREETQQRESVTVREELPEAGSQDQGENAAETRHQSGLTFRVSCRCSGTIGKAVTAQEVGRVIGVALMRQFGWKADLRNPDLEVFIHLNDIYSVVGIPVLRVPLASRAYIKTAGLRSTIAWAMASLAEIKAGVFVLDPMCGLGTILLEAAKEWPGGFYVGADVSDSQLLGAYDNLKAAGLEDKIELLKLSVLDLPLPSESIDVIISDIPFGKKFKLAKDIKRILQEMERVLRAGGTIVLLLGENHYRRLTSQAESGLPPDAKGSHMDGPGTGRCLKPEDKMDSPGTVASSFNTSNQEYLDQMSPFGSLVPTECYKVSLGKTDAFLCKYKKAYPYGS
ncbi:THUMP domain-containing protein 2-like isoform X2 [Ochotona curzoniae]|uniref:THUMP domain-containing protein 2-like isoform X2 n=1 Tax=Ochotona curzoniae TaxID=130825 RepID=UPI001B350CFE|nr:THUMP domain-containing protein 2-like isoform X2 [Ochotona curzoniae]